MKKLILFIVLFVSFLYAAGGNAPTYAAVDGGYEFEVDSTYLPANLLTDSLSGDDTLQIIDALNPTKGNRYGWQYILAYRGLLGDSADNAIVQVYVDSKDAADSLIKHVLIDTMVEAGGFILLPLIGTMIGHTYDVSIISLTATDHVYLSGLSLYRRRVYNVSRRWDGN